MRFMLVVLGCMALAGCQRSCAPLPTSPAPPEALTHQGTNALAAVLAFRVWDGNCQGGGSVELEPCRDGIALLAPTADGVYRPFSQEQGLTVDVVFSNPRVRDRHLRIDIRYSWRPPDVSSGTSDIPEFDYVNVGRSQLARRFIWATTRADAILPDDGVMYFRLIETGVDIPTQSQLVELRFRFRQPVPAGRPLKHPDRRIAAVTPSAPS